MKRTLQIIMISLILFLSGCGKEPSDSDPSATTVTLQSIAITPTDPSVAKDLTQQLTAMGTYSDGTTVDITASSTWSSDTTAASTVVSSTGLVTAVDVGSSVMTATKDFISGTTTVTTTAATVVSIAVTPADPSIAKGLTQQLTAMGTYSDGTTVDITASSTWSSDTTSVATVVSDSGLATAVDVGSAVITVDKDFISATTTMTVTSATLVSIAITPSVLEKANGLSLQLTAIGTYSDGSTTDISSSVTWTSATTSVATINSSGLVSCMNFGTSLITATKSGVSVSRIFTVY